MEREKGERMNEMVEFTAELFVGIGRRDAQIRRALRVLQQAQRYDCMNSGDGMVSSESGTYVDISDVSKAIKILQEEQ